MLLLSSTTPSLFHKKEYLFPSPDNQKYLFPSPQGEGARRADEVGEGARRADEVRGGRGVSFIPGAIQT